MVCRDYAGVMHAQSLCFSRRWRYLHTVVSSGIPDLPQRKRPFGLLAWFLRQARQNIAAFRLKQRRDANDDLPATKERSPCRTENWR